MAKTTRTDKGNGNVTVLDPVNPPEIELETPADLSEDGETSFEETAKAEEIDKRRGRGHHKEASAGFFARISAFPRADWEKLLLYIYRLAPITDRKASGEPVTYIAKLSEPIDEEYVLKEPNWGGSGKYRVRLNRTNADGKNTPIDVVEFVVENQKYPPRVAPGEWVDDPRNRRWAWAKTYYDGKEPPPATAPAPAAAGPTITELIQGVKELKELSKEAAPAPAPDPVVQFKGMVETVKTILPTPAETPKPDDSLQKFLLTELAAERAANRDLMTRLLDRTNTPSAAPVVDPISEIERYAKLGKTLRDSFGPSKEESEGQAEVARSRMSGTQELIAEGMKHVAPVLEKAFTLLTVVATSNKAQPQQQNARPRPTAQPTPDQPAVEPPPETAAPSQPPQQEPPQQPTMEQVQQQLLNQVLGQATPTLMQYLENPDVEESGESFAGWFCDSAFVIPGAPPPFNRIPGTDAFSFAKQFGKDAIIEAYKKNPQLYGQIAPNPEAETKFAKFLEAFLSYDQNQEGDDE